MVESRYFSGFLAAGAKAERRLVEALTTGARHSGSSEITAGSTVTAVADEWYAGVERRDLAINTLAAYEETLRLHVRPSLGSLRIRDVRVGVVERFIAKVEDRTGKSAARRCRTVLNGITGLAASTRRSTTRCGIPPQSLSTRRTPKR
jgi:hypothetical protein